MKPNFSIFSLKSVQEEIKIKLFKRKLETAPILPNKTTKPVRVNQNSTLQVIILLKHVIFNCNEKRKSFVNK